MADFWKPMSDLWELITTPDVGSRMLKSCMCMLPLLIYILYKFIKTQKPREPSSESYRKIVGNHLLRDIIGHLSLRDQLIVRHVNKDWAAAVHRSLHYRKSCCVKLFNGQKISEFISAFPASRLPASNLFSRVTFEVKPMRILMDQLEVFGRLYGKHIRYLKIHVTTGDSVCADRTREIAERSNQLANRQMKIKVKTFLTYFPNLSKLSIAPDILYGRPHLRAVDERHVPFAVLPQFHTLKQIDAVTNTSIISLLHDIVAKTPCLRIVDLDLEELGKTALVTRQLFALLKNADVDHLRVFLNSADNVLLRELAQSNLRPKELQLGLTTMLGANEDQIEERKFMIFEWLIKLSRFTRLTKLSFRTWEDVTQLALPIHMRHLTSLRFGADVLNVQQNYQSHGPGAFETYRPISQGQVPALRSLVIDLEGLRKLSPDEVFTSVRKLIIVDGQTSTHYDWTTKFPNLTKLEMVAGEDESLTSVLTHVTTLTHLKVMFSGVWVKGEGTTDLNYSFPGQRLTSWWDALTGGIRPILYRTSALEAILQRKPSTIPHCGGDAGNTGKLGNLNKLKTLQLLNAPASIVMAIIHLTSLKQIPPLDKLEILSSCYDPYDPEDECVDLLKDFHDLVKIWCDVAEDKKHESEF